MVSVCWGASDTEDNSTLGIVKQTKEVYFLGLISSFHNKNLMYQSHEKQLLSIS